jgi:hypothetical protein
MLISLQSGVNLVRRDGFEPPVLAPQGRTALQAVAIAALPPTHFGGRCSDRTNATGSGSPRFSKPDHSRSGNLPLKVLAESGRIELLRLIAAPRFSGPLAVHSAALSTCQRTGGPEEIRTLTTRSHWFLRPARLPITPQGLEAVDRSRTDLCGFADRRLHPSASTAKIDVRGNTNTNCSGMSSKSYIRKK